ncbi:MAG: restriction endonuclease subunit S [Bacteroidetes bacterium]|nr:restriction endonuclease subunit S [Bacteroidota bacterium]
MQIIRLKYLFEKRIGGAWGEEPEINNSYVCIRAADFLTDKIAHKTTDLTRRSFKTEEIEKKQLKEGDIIVEKSGGGENQPVGRVVLFSLDEPALCSNFLEILRPNLNILDPKYGAYLLYSLWASRITTKSIKQTTGIQNLDLSEFLDNKVVLPSISEQRKIVDNLETEILQIDTMYKHTLKSLELLEERKSSLIIEKLPGQK